jgi:hypothetical protein
VRGCERASARRSTKKLSGAATFDRPAADPTSSAAAQAALATLVDEAKQGGVAQKAIDAKGLKGVSVAIK